MSRAQYRPGCVCVSGGMSEGEAEFLADALNRTLRKASGTFFVAPYSDVQWAVYTKQR